MTAPGRTTGHRRRLVRAVRARRRWLVAALVAGSVVFGLDAVAPPSPETIPVVVARSDLLPGSTLGADDLRVASWPREVVPQGSLRSVEDVAGRVLAGAVGRGEPLTGLRLVGTELAGGLAGAGEVAVPVRLADGDSAALLRPGDRIDLVAARSGAADPVTGTSGTAAARVVASAATVVTVPRAGSTSTFGVTTATSGALVLVAVSRQEALALAEAAVLGPVSVVLVG